MESSSDTRVKETALTSTAEWLLHNGDPAVEALARVDLLGETLSTADQARVLESPWVQALLDELVQGGKHENHPYQKWGGAHWRLVSLVELGIPAGEPRAVAAAGRVLDWLDSPEHLKQIRILQGRVRRCASQEGNALAVCSRLGMADEPRVRPLAERLVEWQWPDGGWNCDRHPEAHHSSFYESLATLWGLLEFVRAGPEDDLRRAAQASAARAVELFLKHHLFRSTRTGEPIHPEWLKLHYPVYWHYDILQALLILSRSGPLTDPRVQEALDIVEAKRRPDGTWRAEGWYWKPPGKPGSNVEVVHWDRSGPNRMLTLNALRVLKAAGRL